jgi:hypothetical protein
MNGGRLTHKRNDGGQIRPYFPQYPPAKAFSRAIIELVLNLTLLTKTVHLNNFTD